MSISAKGTRPRATPTSAFQEPDAGAVDVSIVVCTRDRYEHLQACITQIGAAEVPPGWVVELLVVDNGSRDGTGAFATGCQLPNIAVRYVLEPTKGKAHACNSGLAAARGNVLLFTDDDAHVPRDWIEGMCRPIFDGEGDAVQGGVRIAPHLDRPWLKGVLRGWVAEVADASARPQGLVGANMAFSRAAMLDAKPFDIELGPGAAGFFDDTVFGWDLEAAGRKILYRPSIAVEHHFDQARLSLQAFLSTARHMAASRVLALRGSRATARSPTWLGLLALLPRLVVRSLTQALRYAFDRRPDAGFVHAYYRLCLWRAMRRT